MMSLFLVVPLVLVAIALVVGLMQKSRRRKSPLKKGDYVMLRKRFQAKFPGVPVTHALIIEQLDTGNATVVFMNLNNQVLKQVIPLYALAKAS